MRYITLLITTLFAAPALAGDFKISYDHVEMVVDYTGTVEFDDDVKLKELMTDAGSQDVYIFINSPGGSAWGGVGLYLEAQKWENLILVAGSDFGAWSAAAMFWMGAESKHVEVGGIVGLHLAYCNPYNPPGCDTTDIDEAMLSMFHITFGVAQGDRIWKGLHDMRDKHGVSGWVGIINTRFHMEGWFTFDSSLTEIKPFNIEG